MAAAGGGTTGVSISSRGRALAAGLSGEAARESGLASRLGGISSGWESGARAASTSAKILKTALHLPQRTVVPVALTFSSGRRKRASHLGH
jgi:hypothetical protein